MIFLALSCSDIKNQNDLPVKEKISNNFKVMGILPKGQNQEFITF